MDLVGRAQPRGRNNLPRARNLALNWAQGEVGVSLKKKKIYSPNHSTNRVLTRILKVGVRDSSSVKNRSPRPNLGVPLSKS